MKIDTFSPFWLLLAALGNLDLMRSAAHMAAMLRRLGDPLAATVPYWQAEARRCHARAAAWLRRWSEELHAAA